MTVLGIAGGPHRLEDDARQFPLIDGYWHDAAAVIVDEGRVVYAYEEERLNRVKHTCSFPTLAVRECLAQSALRLSDLDAIGIYFTEQYWDTFLTERLLLDSQLRLGSARQTIAARLTEATGCVVDLDKLRFVRHHEAHAICAWNGSGFDEALVVTLDGAGDAESGLVAEARGSKLRELWTLPISHSLGGLYLWITRFLGFAQFDEYKVMGLAASGDPRRLGDRLKFIQLRSDGRFSVDWQFTERLRAIATPRRKGDEVTPFHADLAAAVQGAVEDATLHLLRHAQRQTRLKNLCLSGGVAQNCVMVGKVAAIGQFEGIFVHPASHDAGCAVGAALVAEDIGHQSIVRPATPTVYWGRDVSPADLRSTAERWRQWIDFETYCDTLEWAAAQLASGAILGWVRGRAEFGPRALGHRSLLADPRPADNRDRINGLIKGRESFRPLAPVVQSEFAHRYFLIPSGVDCSFMSFALPVRPEWRTELAAITHTDGTARLQTVTRTQDEVLWSLLGHFARLTDVHLLLNTSLNVAGDPIADSVDDVIACLLLAPEIAAVVVEGAVLRRASGCELSQLAVVLPRDARLSQMQAGVDRRERSWIIERAGPRRASAPVSLEAVEFLRHADGGNPLSVATRGVAHAPKLLEEIMDLWRLRLVTLCPPGSSGQYGHIPRGLELTAESESVRRL